MGYINGQVQPEGKRRKLDPEILIAYIHQNLSLTQFIYFSCFPSTVVAFPAAPSPSPTLAYPTVPSYLPAESSFTPDVAPGVGVEDLPDSAGTASLALDSAAATGTHGEAQVPEQPDDLLQEQLPRQIHIQQHLKLHFHPQGKSRRG